MDSIIISCLLIWLHDSLFTDSRSYQAALTYYEWTIDEPHLLGKKCRPRCYQTSSGVLGWLSYTKCRWLGQIHTIIKFPKYNVLSRTLPLLANSVSVIDKPLWSQMKVFCCDFNKLFTPTIHISKFFFIFVARCTFWRDLIISLSCIVQWHFHIHILVWFGSK